MLEGWSPPFADRTEAGRALARRLVGRVSSSAVVLALPRGGVPVAFEIAKALGAPLDVLVVRKLGVPGHEELAMGAIASGGYRALNAAVLRALRIPPHVIDAVVARELRILTARERLWRSGLPPMNLVDREVILVDDGIATGASARVAVTAARSAGAKRVVVAAPVAPASLEPLGEDALVLLEAADPFDAVGAFYQDFSQTTDVEVSRLLEVARAWVPQPA